MTKSNTCLFATVLYLIRETVYGRQKKKKKKKGGGGDGNGLAAGCQLFDRKIYGYFLQCRHR